MAAITNWVSYYRANRNDGDTIEALYALDDEELAEIASGHNNNVSALRTTIANSGGGNVLLVPGSKGSFTSSTRDSPRLPTWEVRRSWDSSKGTSALHPSR
jgi:hypothetical protein